MCIFAFYSNAHSFTSIKKNNAETDYAISLNGNGLLTPINSVVPEFSPNFTISAWIYPAAGSSGERTIAAWASSNSGQIGNFFRLEGDNHLYYGQWDGTFKKVKSNTPIISGLWSHVALVKNNNQISFYLNGEDVTGNYVSGAAPMNNNAQGDAFRFGGLFQNGSAKEFFKGSMDDIAYTTARTATEIKLI